MQFKEWNDSLLSQASSFIRNMVGTFLRTEKTEKGQVRYTFPDYVRMTNTYQPMALAAGTDYNGPKVNESWSAANPLGKGHYIFKQLEPTRMVQDMTPRQAYDFKRKMTSSLSDIAKEMGLIFEIELFLYMIEQKGILPYGEYNKGWARNQVAAYYAAISEKTNETFSRQVASMINHHVDQLGENIYDKAMKSLSCKPDQIEFTGGNTAWSKWNIDQRGHRTTSDFILRCTGESGHVGFTSKFFSESATRIADLWFNQAYNLLGGKKIKGFSEKVKSLEFDDKQRGFIINVFGVLLDNLSRNPNKLNFVINKLLFGTEESEEGPETISNVLPAFRNYVVGRGKADFSDNMKLDFDIDYNVAQKIKIKRGSQIQSRTTAVAAIINISNPNGSKHGTYIKFQVEQDKVVVTMNNLA